MITPNPNLQQLRDIHFTRWIPAWLTLPELIVMVVVSLVLLIFGFYIWNKRRKQRYTIHYAMQRLDQLEKLMLFNPENIHVAAELSIIIRRTALYYFQRDDVAGLAGRDWLQFLNKSGQTTQFTSEAGQLLIDAPYRKINYEDLTALIELTKNWLKVIRKTKMKGT